MKRYFSTDKFIEKARTIYGDKYEYNKTKYYDSKTKIIVTCKKHGDFEQNPSQFLRGFECPICKDENKKRKLSKKNKADFIKTASTVHQNKYDYSKIVWRGCFSNLRIICPIHGEFRQQASVHKIGHGCPQCANESGNMARNRYILRYKFKISELIKTYLTFFEKSLTHFYVDDCGEPKTNQVLV